MARLHTVAFESLGNSPGISRIQMLRVILEKFTYFIKPFRLPDGSGSLLFAREFVD